jgi:hypothetical protein
VGIGPWGSEGSNAPTAVGVGSLWPLAPPHGTCQYAHHGKSANEQEEHEARRKEKPRFQLGRHDTTVLNHYWWVDLGNPIAKKGGLAALSKSGKAQFTTHDRYGPP